MQKEKMKIFLSEDICKYQISNLEVLLILIIQENLRRMKFISDNFGTSLFFNDKDKILS